jgi:hypothetical protein
VDSKAAPELKVSNGKLVLVYQNGNKPRTLFRALYSLNLQKISEVPLSTEVGGTEQPSCTYTTESGQLVTVFSTFSGDATARLMWASETVTQEVFPQVGNSSVRALEMVYDRGFPVCLLATRQGYHETGEKRSEIWSYTVNPDGSLANPTVWLSDTETPQGFAVEEVTALKTSGGLTAFFNGFETHKTSQQTVIHHRLYYKHEADSAQEVQFQSEETTRSIQLVRAGTGFIWSAVTGQNSAHPRSVMKAQISALDSGVPNFDNLTYKKPMNAAVLGVSLSDDMLNKPAHQDRIAAGTCLLKFLNEVTPTLTYYDLRDNLPQVWVDPLSYQDVPRDSAVQFKVQVSDEDQDPVYWTTVAETGLAVTQTDTGFQAKVLHCCADGPKTITVEVFSGNDKVTQTVQVTPQLHQVPNLLVQNLETNWHTKVAVSLTPQETVGYPTKISLDAGKNQGLFTVDINSMGKGWVTPLRTDVNGATYEFTATISDCVSSRQVPFTLTVDPFPADLLGERCLSLYKYNGSMRTANEGLGHTLLLRTSLLSDFVEVERVNLIGRPWLLTGSQSILLVEDWSTVPNFVYFVCYESVVKARMNTRGLLAVLTESNLLMIQDLNQKGYDG